MTVDELNLLPAEEAWRVLKRCCGATAWYEYVCEHRPYEGRKALDAASKAAFDAFDEEDWLEAFAHHPKIGEAQLRKRFAATAAWAESEQQGMRAASEAVIEALAEANTAYKTRFGYIYIMCATGKSAEEMLKLCRARLENEPAQELAIAAGEQRKITALRLDRLFESA